MSAVEQNPASTSINEASDANASSTTTDAPILSTKTELEILNRLKQIRDRLYNLRKSPSAGTKELNRLWKEVATLVKEVAVIRFGKVPDVSVDAIADGTARVSTVLKTGTGAGATAVDVAIATSSYDETSSEVDMVLDDIAPMFFQFWSHTGKVSEHLYPVYVKLAKTKHVLDQLNESGLFTQEVIAEAEKNIASLAEQVEEFKKHKATTTAVAASSAPVPAAPEGVKGTGAGRGLQLVEEKLEACVALVKDLRETLNTISPALLPVHARLVEIKSELSTLLSRGGAHAFSLAEVQMLQDELREIDSIRIDGKFIGREGGGSVVAGQAAVIGLMELCYEDVHELLALREAIGGENPLRGVYERLIRIKGKLENLERSVGRFSHSAFSCVKSEDLVPVQMELGEIDNLRVDGKFVAFVDGVEVVPEGQAVLHFLLHKCYRKIYKLQTVSEPVAEPLMPVFNQLTTLKKCLLELKKWKVGLSSRELSIYQMRLAQIDNKRVDGKFYGDDGFDVVHEGQGVLHDLLHENYELLRYLFRIAEDEEGLEGDDEEEEEEVEEEEGEGDDEAEDEEDD
ncbi:hypothetical protein HDU76_006719 [Blyttiomyces sp. JEL0837]|nr:hypothetical protein HDU76_006719 [Blyttiomyces sp. JEL0837]